MFKKIIHFNLSNVERYVSGSTEDRWACLRHFNHWIGDSFLSLQYECLCDLPPVGQALMHTGPYPFRLFRDEVISSPSYWPSFFMNKLLIIPWKENLQKEKYTLMNDYTPSCHGEKTLQFYHHRPSMGRRKRLCKETKTSENKHFISKRSMARSSR